MVEQAQRQNDSGIRPATTDPKLIARPMKILSAESALLRRPVPCSSRAIFDLVKRDGASLASAHARIIAVTPRTDAS
jgi:hypothetical protein